MKKLPILLLTALLAALCCSAALAYDFPTDVERFPYAPEMFSDHPLALPSYTVTVASNGTLALDVDWTAVEAASPVTRSSVMFLIGNKSYFMTYQKNDGLYHLIKPPRGVDAEHPTGYFRIFWTTASADTATMDFSAATGELLSLSGSYEYDADSQVTRYTCRTDDGDVVTLDYAANGQVIRYAYSGIGKDWTIFYGEGGTAALQDEYQVLFPDGMSVLYSRMGIPQGMATVQENIDYWWGWNNETEQYCWQHWDTEKYESVVLEDYPPFDPNAYPAPWKAEPDLRVYATLADAGIDRAALLASLQAEMPENVPEETHTFVTSDGLEAEVSFDWDTYEVTGFTLFSGYSDDYPFDTLRIPIDPERDVTLKHDLFTSYYNADGVLKEYTYQIDYGVHISYTVYGYAAGIGGSKEYYDAYYDLVFHPDSLTSRMSSPATLVGKIPGAVTPPDVKVYATVDGAVGCDITTVTARALVMISEIAERYDDLRYEAANKKASAVEMECEDGSTITIYFQDNPFRLSHFTFSIADDVEITVDLSSSSLSGNYLYMKVLRNGAARVSIQITLKDEGPDYRLEYGSSVAAYYNAAGLLTQYSYEIGETGFMRYSTTGMTGDETRYPPLDIIDE